MNIFILKKLNIYIHYIPGMAKGGVFQNPPPRIENSRKPPPLEKF